MKAFGSTLLLLLTSVAFAGGSTFEIQIVSMIPETEVSSTLKFKVLTTPYYEKIQDFTKGQDTLSIKIDYDCDFFCRLKSKPLPTLKNHKSAMAELEKIALPNAKISVGLMGGNLVPINANNGLYKVGALDLHDGIVYFYKYAQ
jgi:hypothetical protein